MERAENNANVFVVWIRISSKYWWDQKEGSADQISPRPWLVPPHLLQGILLKFCRFAFCWNWSHYIFEPIHVSWEKAIQLFNSRLIRDENKKIVLADISQAQFSDLLQSVNAARDNVERSRYFCTQVLQRVFAQIDRYAVIRDIIVQHHAEYTSLVWGIIRFLLLIRFNFMLIACLLNQFLYNSLLKNKRVRKNYLGL